MSSTPPAIAARRFANGRKLEDSCAPLTSVVASVALESKITAGYFFLVLGYMVCSFFFSDSVRHYGYACRASRTAAITRIEFLGSRSSVGRPEWGIAEPATVDVEK